jgi:hypothetical protein
LWFRNALTSEIVSSSRAIVHWTVILMSHQGAAGNHRFSLFFGGKVTNCRNVRSMVFLIRSSALLITVTLISWSKFSVFCGFSTKYIEWTHYRNVMSAPPYVFLGLKSSDVYRQTPGIAPPFVSPNLWQYIEDDDKSKYCVLVKFGSQILMGAKWMWRYIRG